MHPPDNIPWRTSDILDATRAERLCGNADGIFAGIAIDSRNAEAENLFVAIRGEVHDGHAFLDDVIGRGVRGVMIDRREADTLPVAKWAKKNILCLAVEDTTRALGDLAAFHRTRAGVSVVAITGSNGKTTTREMILSILARRFHTLSPERNFNNEIGVPLTLFRLGHRHQWAVLELGMNHAGEIARLTEICSPDVGVITNIGPAHLEGVGSMEGAAAAKGELLDGMEPEAWVVLNADDPRVTALGDRAAQSVLYFGRSKSARVRAETIRARAGSVSFDLVLPSDRSRVKLKTPGAFMVSNALAAAAVGHLLGLPPGEIRAGLEAFRPVAGRMHLIETDRRISVIDDTYNANPGSMAAAIRTLAAMNPSGRTVLVAGDMLELGENAEGLHGEIGTLCAESRIDRLWVTGDFAGAVAAAAKGAGMDPDGITTGSKPSLIDGLTRSLEGGDVVLVKGSRAMKMEEIVTALLDWAGGAGRKKTGRKN